MNNPQVIFDSYAFFAYINDEEGADLVDELLQQATENRIVIYLHRINWGEIYYKMYRKRGSKRAEEIIQKIDALPIVVDDTFDGDFVKAVAEVKGKHPVSYADAFAINLALSKNIPLVTDDPEIAKVAKQESRLQLLWS